MKTIIENIPICECHNIKMIWHKKNDRKSGGSWQCRVKGWAEDSRYNNSTKGYIARRKRELSILRKNIIIELRGLEYDRRTN